MAVLLKNHLELFDERSFTSTFLFLKAVPLVFIIYAKKFLFGTERC